MSLDHLKTVRPGDYVTAEQWNALIAVLKREHTGPALIRTPGGYHTRPDAGEGGGGGTAGFQLVIIRRIENAADLEVKVEFAREGRNFDTVGIYEDYGRYVGYHEYMRTAPDAEPPMPPIEDYWHDARLFCHTTGAGWKGVLWPPIENPEDPVFYRDTHVERTPIFLAFKPGRKWIILPTFRMWTAKVDDSARHHDCIVEGTSA